MKKTAALVLYVFNIKEISSNAFNVSGGKNHSQRKQHQNSSLSASAISTLASDKRSSHRRRSLPEVHTALLTWRRLERSIDDWPLRQKHLALRATYIAFVSLNDVSDPEGAPLVYSGICNAKRLLYKHRRGLVPIPKDKNQLAQYVVTMLLRESCLNGRCCLSSLEKNDMIPNTIVHDLRVALNSSRGDFLQYITNENHCSDGWEAARILELRGDLLLPDDDFIIERVSQMYADPQDRSEAAKNLRAELQCIGRRYCSK